MRHVSVFVLKCIHFISSPIISFFFAIVIFRFLRTFFQYTFVLGVINWINLLDIHYEIPLEYYGLIGDIGSSASYALYSLSAIQILPCINNLIQGLNLYLNKLKPNAPLLNLYISFLIVVQIVCISWNTGAGAYGAAVMISKSVDGVNPTHMQIVATVINSKSLMLYLSELLVRKIDDINDPTIRKMSKYQTKKEFEGQYSNFFKLNQELLSLILVQYYDILTNHSKEWLVGDLMINIRS